MADPNYLSYDPNDYMDDLIDEHHPDIVFPDLDDDDRPNKMEWSEEPTMIQMGCGCRVEVLPGDTVWTLPGRLPGQQVPVAIEPVTIH